jgi:hypothetical protein
VQSLYCAAAVANGAMRFRLFVAPYVALLMSSVKIESADSGAENGSA